VGDAPLRTDTNDRGQPGRLLPRRPIRVGAHLLGGPAVLTCVPLAARDREDLAGQTARLAEWHPDCVEWRADYLRDLDADEVPELLRAVTATVRAPVLFTCRMPAEGGAGTGDEPARIAVLDRAAATGLPALIDVEMATPAASAAHVVDAARRRGVAVVRSWHDLAATPPQAALLGALRAMQDAGADVAKVAVTPRTPDDVLALLATGLEARRSFLEIPAILIAMGPLGALTRVSGHFGSDLTFAAGAVGSAPGQLSLELVRAALAEQGLGPSARQEREES
jgi:3-dehydroquinate dehydratase-1